MSRFAKENQDGDREYLWKINFTILILMLSSINRAVNKIEETPLMRFALTNFLNYIYTLLMFFLCRMVTRLESRTLRILPKPFYH